MKKFIKRYDQISMADVDSVGGKNASLGEMIKNLKSLGVRVPDGFAITASAYDAFLVSNDLPERLGAVLNRLNRKSLDNLEEISEKCRALVLGTPLPEIIVSEIRDAHVELMSHGITHSVA